MQIISVREYPEYKDEAIQYFQSKWASENSLKVYEDSITYSIATESVLPIKIVKSTPSSNLSSKNEGGGELAFFNKFHIKDGFREHAFGIMVLREVI